MKVVCYLFFTCGTWFSLLLQATATNAPPELSMSCLRVVGDHAAKSFRKEDPICKDLKRHRDRSLISLRFAEGRVSKENLKNLQKQHHGNEEAWTQQSKKARETLAINHSIAGAVPGYKAFEPLPPPEHPRKRPAPDGGPSQEDIRRQKAEASHAKRTKQRLRRQSAKKKKDDALRLKRAESLHTHRENVQKMLRDPWVMQYLLRIWDARRRRVG